MLEPDLTRKPMRYLNFDLSESGDSVITLEAMASTNAEQHAAVMAEVQQVLGWASRHFPHSHGPVDDGHHWHHDLQVVVEEAHQGGAWHSVTLTLSGSDSFVAEFLAAFASPPD